MRKLLALVAMTLALIVVPSEVSAATQPKAPAISKVEVLSPLKTTISFKLDTAHKKLIKSIQYSIDSGKTWKRTTNTAVTIATKPETEYSFQLAQLSTSNKRVVIKRTFATGPVLPGFTVQQLLWTDEFN